MGQAYYYFVSTLPILLFGHKPHMTMEGFLRSCDTLLSAKDNEAIKRVLAETPQAGLPDSNEAVVNIAKFCHSFNNMVAAFRAQRAGKDPKDYIQGERYDNPFLVEVLQRAAKDPNLLAAERAVVEAKWDYLDNFAVGHNHDLAFLCVYGLKLKIAERMVEIGSPKGLKIFEKYEMFGLTDDKYMAMPEHRSTK